MLGAEKRAVQIGLNHTIPKFHRHIGDQRPARNVPGEVRHDRRIIDHHVDLAETVDHLVESVS